MSRLRKALVVLLVTAAPSVAAAAEVDARAITILAGRPDARDGTIYTVVPIFELVSLNARQLDLPAFDDVRVVVSLWGRLDPADPADDDTADGDIDLGYIEGALGKGQLRLRLGRQLVFAGGTRGQGLDGLLVESRFGPLGLMVYGGLPVTPRFGVDQGDGMWGARLSLRKSVDAELGLSYIHMIDDGRVSRFDFGIDARYARRKFMLTALGLLSAMETRIAEARVTASYRVTPALQIFLDLAHTAPDLFLSRASILSVFAEAERNEGGGIVSWRPLETVRTRASYHALDNEEGLGHRAEIAADADVARGLLIGAEAGLLALPEDGYVHGRLFGRANVAKKMAVTLEGDLYQLEEEVNGTGMSARAAASWRWDPTPAWRAVVSGLVGSDPLYEVRWEAMLKVAWTYDSRGRR